MNGYDADWRRRNDARLRGYSSDFRGGYDRELRRGGAGGASGGFGGWSGAQQQGGRGAYGEAYPGYGGYPGGQNRGMYYGGRGYGGDYTRGRGGGGGASSYDRGFARERFIPEEVYRRHHEFDRPQRHDSAGPWEEGGGGGRRIELSDRDLQRAVRDSLNRDPWVDSQRISLDVSNGVVTLRGEVDDFMEARYVWDDAWETPGVHGVVNNLTVRVDIPADADQEPMFPQSSGD
jgi:hypothetical protein